MVSWYAIVSLGICDLSFFRGFISFDGFVYILCSERNAYHYHLWELGFDVFENGNQ